MTSEATTTSATATTTTTTGTIAGTTLADGVDASSDAPLGAFVGVSSKKASVRRPKRKQGVACDTCRLRRVRCDLTERPEGTGCSRCEDKRINCTDEYIQAKKKGKTGASGTPSGSNSNSSGAATAPGEIISIGNDAHPSVSDQSYRRGSPDDWSSETEIPSISTSLSTSLIQTFFHTTHFALTILDAFTFLARYDSAGHRAEAMDGPVGPVLAAAVEAWGARCSAEQVIFDENVWRTPYGAEGVDARGTLDPASTRASLVWGQRREAFCRMMLDRALQMADERGAMRIINAESVQTLLLLGSLCNYDSDLRQQCRALHVAAFDQCQILKLGRSFHVEALETEEAIEHALSEFRKIKLFWAAWITDAMTAAEGRTEPKFLEDELVTVNNLIPSHSSRKAHQSMRRHAAVVPPLVVYKASELSLARAAGFVMVAFPFVGTLARFIAFRITSGLPVPGGHGGTPRGRARRIEDIAVACREVWPRLDECLTMFDRCLGKAGVALHRWNNFSAPNWIANLKLGIMLLFAVIHEAIEQKYDAARAVTVAGANAGGAGLNGGVLFEFGPDRNPRRSSVASGSDQLSPLDLLYEESARHMLVQSRRAAHYVQSVLASGVIKDGSAAFTKIIRVAQFLASTPVLRPRPMHTEPPVPTTYGFWVDPVQHYDYEPRDRWILRAGAGVAEDWTWETKVREVGWLLDGMEQLGWTWAKPSIEIPVIEDCMRRKAPAGCVWIRPRSLHSQPLSPLSMSNGHSIAPSATVGGSSGPWSNAAGPSPGPGPGRSSSSFSSSADVSLSLRNWPKTMPLFNSDFAKMLAENPDFFKTRHAGSSEGDVEMAAAIEAAASSPPPPPPPPPPPAHGSFHEALPPTNEDVVPSVLLRQHLSPRSTGIPLHGLDGSASAQHPSAAWTPEQRMAFVHDDLAASTGFSVMHVPTGLSNLEHLTPPFAGGQLGSGGMDAHLLATTTGAPASGPGAGAGAGASAPVPGLPSSAAMVGVELGSPDMRDLAALDELADFDFDGFLAQMNANANSNANANVNANANANVNAHAPDSPTMAHPHSHAQAQGRAQGQSQGQSQS